MQKIAVIAQQFNIGQIIKISKFGKGLINLTYLIETKGEQGVDKFVLQKLHSRIGNEVIIDIYEITKHLEKKGFLTTTLVKARKGSLFIEDTQETWRMMTFIDGKTIYKIEEKPQAQSAGSVIGRFHRSLLDCEHIFLHNITHFHDTDYIVRHMKNIIFKHENRLEFQDLKEMSDFVFSKFSSINGTLKHLPERIVHGDLKLSNIIYDTDSVEAISLVDLDTMARNKIAIDLGDALRSICNTDSSFDLEIFTYFIDGYFSEAHFLTKDETRSIATGLATIILELAARYITDAIEQSYFRLDDSKFPDLYTQNKTKAVSNIKLYEDFLRKKHLIENILCEYL